MSSPKVSMIMPCYNSAEYIDLMLESIINQSYENIELIAAYDSSPDNTLEKLKEWQGKFLKKGYKLIIVENTERLGIAGGINKALSYFTGDYITFPDSDDFMSPKFCEILVNALEENVQYNYASCDNYIVSQDKNGQKATTITHAYDKNYKNIDDKLLYLFGIIPRAPWRLMIRAAYFKSVFPKLQLYPHPSSHEMPFRMPLSKEPFLHIEIPLYSYLLHDESYTLSRRKSYHSIIPYYDSMEMLANDMIDLLPMPLGIKQNYYLANKINYLLIKLDCLISNGYEGLSAYYSSMLMKAVCEYDASFVWPVDFDICKNIKWVRKALPHLLIDTLPSYMTDLYPTYLDLVSGKKVILYGGGENCRLMLRLFVRAGMNVTEIWDRNAEQIKEIDKINVISAHANADKTVPIIITISNSSGIVDFINELGYNSVFDINETETFFLLSAIRYYFPKYFRRYA